jgi:NADH-quinone oxidoreductase subunit N
MMREIDLSTPLGVTIALLPEVLLTVWALVVLLVVAWRHRTAEDSRFVGLLSLAGVVASGVAVAYLWAGGFRALGVPHMVALDAYRFGGAALFLLSAAVTIGLSIAYLPREGMLAPEYYPLILLATVGMMFLGGAEDLIVTFLGLEVMSVAIYVLTGYDRRSPFSAEAGLKYFLIGAFASGFLLYGIALTWGTTGTTNLVMTGAQLSTAGTPLMAAMGLGLILIGFAFKVAAVPFHMWAPDAYDGAPTPITGFMATGVKAAAFLALVRILLEAFPHAVTLWQPVLGLLALVTMVVGNLIALSQRSVKRMLAYSSVAHAGYLLVALWPGTTMSAGATLLYLLAYGLTTLAAFGILAVLGRNGERDVTIDGLAGLAGERPWLALAMSVCMLSLLGFPGTFGFIGKWYILSAVVAEGHLVLPVVLVVTSVISAAYYLPVIMAMYMKPAAAPDAHNAVSLRGLAAGFVAATVVAVVLFGVWPSPALDAAQDTAATLTRPLTIPVAAP